LYREQQLSLKTTQAKKIEKARAKGVGIDLHLSRAQIKRNKSGVFLPLLGLIAEVAIPEYLLQSQLDRVPLKSLPKWLL